MRILRRMIPWLLALLLIATSIGCQPAAQGDATSPATTSAVPATSSNPAAPSLEAPAKVTYWIMLNPNVTANYMDMDDTPFAKEVSARTGVEVDYIASTTDDSFNLMMAAKEYPDIIEFWWDSYPGGPMKAVEDGVIVPISSMMEKAPNLAAWLEANPEIANQMRWDDGTIMGWQAVSGGAGIAAVGSGPIIRKDLLEKNGLAIPETVDEWYTALTAFRDGGVTSPFISNERNDFIARAYGIMLGDSVSFYLEGDTVVSGPIQPAFRDYMTTWSKWYSEGLLDQDIGTMTDDISNAKMIDGSAASSTGYATRLATLNNEGQKLNAEYSAVGAPAPVLVKGELNKYPPLENAYSPGGAQAVITTACKNVDAAVKVCDYIWGPEGNMLANWGIEGITYEMGADGTPSFTDFVLHNPDNWTVYQVRGGYMRSYGSGPYPQSGNLYEKNFILPVQHEAYALWSKAYTLEHLLPPTRRTPEEDVEFATIMADVNTYYREALLLFTLGNRSLEEYDIYLKEIKSLGIERALEIQQAAYDRYKAKFN